MVNRFKYTNTNKRYYTLDYYNKNKYGIKVAKVSLNGGFTCPNKDGSKGYGGCIYCSKLGSGDFAGNINDDIIKQFNDIKKVIDNKWNNIKYIGYFQANTNTYANVDKLKSIYEPIVNLDDVIGISIATRCDAISDECFQYLKDLNNRTNLTIELGLQSIYEDTAKFINRGHSLKEFDDMVSKLINANINVVVHIINGLPNETKEMMINTVKHLNKLKINGIKIHMLHITKNTLLDDIYIKNPFHILTKDEYIDIVCDQIECLNEDIVIHRLTGDPVKEDLIEPSWVLNKIDVLNGIDKELARRNTYQGFNKTILNRGKEIMDRFIKPNDIVIDATCGNGNDSLFMAKLVPKGFLYGFDIQDVAINNTDKLLKDNGISNYKLFNKSHAFLSDTLNKYKNKISFINFNLGYLPNGDKNITTTWDSTKVAIINSLELLNEKGIILITVYKGHDNGLIESNNLLEFVKDYDYKIYHNDDNDISPYIITIKK